MSPLFYLQFLLYSMCLSIFTMFTSLVYYRDKLQGNWRNIQPEYDYVIVGAGTAGSLIAHRMATETNYTFVVLEAGSRGHFLMDIPIVGPALHRSLFDWNYETEPQENACFAMENKKCRLTQGKIVGGSSKLNNMVHVRGKISHYVNWFNGKYTEDHITQQFEFIENNLLHLNDNQYESNLANIILNAAIEVGYDYLSAQYKNLKEGFSRAKLSQRNGKRWAISDKLNLSNVITNVIVDKIVIKYNVAKAVSFIIDDTNHEVLASKGVILAAGALNTPKILQLSGIGPAKLLNSLNIKIIKDLPVGENLQDHIGTGLDLIFMEKHPKLSGNDILDPINHFSYFLQGKGPLTTAGVEVNGFISTNNNSVIDLQFMVLPTGISSDRGTHLRKVLGINDKTWEKYFVNIFDRYTASIVPILLHPKSKGTVYLKSTNVRDPPLINPRYLAHLEDRNTLVRGLHIVKRILETEVFKDAKAYINPIPFPGCDKEEIFSDRYWECYIKHLTLSIYHPVGTCSMGFLGKGVVDTNFNVFGIKNLYVADSSALPTLPSGNPNAAVAMMASLFFDSHFKTKKYQSGCCCVDDSLQEHLLKICMVKAVRLSLLIKSG